MGWLYRVPSTAVRPRCGEANGKLFTTVSFCLQICEIPLTRASGPPTEFQVYRSVSCIRKGIHPPLEFLSYEKAASALHYDLVWSSFHLQERQLKVPKIVACWSL